MALDHFQAALGEQAEQLQFDGLGVGCLDDRQRDERKKAIPDVHGVPDAVFRPRGDLIASLAVAVGDVVVDQRRVLEMLDRRGEIEGRGRWFPEELARQDGQGGPEPFAAAGDLIDDALAQRRHIRNALDLLGKSFPNLLADVVQELVQVGIERVLLGVERFGMQLGQPLRGFRTACCRVRRRSKPAPTISPVTLFATLPLRAGSVERERLKTAAVAPSTLVP